LGAASFLDSFWSTGERTRDDLGPLQIYQRFPVIASILVGALILYLVLAHRAWKRMEVYA
jgi:hypothetical protein